MLSAEFFQASLIKFATRLVGVRFNVLNAHELHRIDGALFTCGTRELAEFVRVRRHGLDGRTAEQRIQPTSESAWLGHDARYLSSVRMWVMLFFCNSSRAKLR